MTDILKRADAFRLGANPTPDDVDKANMLITELSAQVADLRKAARVAAIYALADNAEVCEAIDAQQAAEAETARLRGMLDVDALAQAIRIVDGNHDLGAGALAEAIVAHFEKGGW